MTKSEDALIKEIKNQLKQTKTARRKRLLKRIVMHFKEILPGIIGLAVGLIIGELIWFRYWYDLPTKVVFSISGYIAGYIIFKVNA